ncbi:WD40 repeat-like protein [Choiromyces venosus 120613-1]|uniref:WD40 repeat-like protein n=1 Tax=Choiromyces venosus 120613-1 TaxID=1336337 RepID=A0A3N4K8D7_9PEZI|nr:WD40 repeat-like protein [Choiromyces venosus 120613-1]
MSLKPIPGEEEYAGSDNEPTIEEPDLAPDDPMRAFLPKSFGKQTVERDVKARVEQTRRAPPPPPPPSSSSKAKPPQDSDSDSDDDSSEEEEEYPLSHELIIPAHTKPISSITLDPAGTRFVTSSHDTTIKFFDFHAMSSTHLHSFKTLEPSEAHHIHSVAFSPLDSGQHILVVPAAPQAKILTRDGDTVLEFVKGDPYLRDMHNTKGHVSEITAGCWSPVQRGVVATAGTDSTVRIWDVQSRRGHRDIMVHKSRGKGGRSRICTVAWCAGVTGGGGSSGSAGGGMIGTMALDGTLSIWNAGGPYSRPVMEVREAHTKETWTAGLTFSSDGRLIATMGEDQFIKLWDTRKLKTPITSRANFPTPPTPTHPLLFSPTTNTTLLTGDTSGALHILSSATLLSEQSHPLRPSSSPLTSITWHPAINQILAGTSSGNLHILYSPLISRKGATTLLSRAPRKRHIDDDLSTTSSTAISADAVILPNALLTNKPPTSAAGSGGGDRRRPAMPAQTPWGKSQPDQRHVDKSIGLSSMRDEDPREALLKYAEVAERDPVFTAAWKVTQPKTIYADVEGEEGEEDEGKGKGKGVKRVRR